MNIPRIVDAIGYIDDDLITAALEDPPRKRHNLMIKWMSVAACLALVMIAGILVPHLLKNDATAESKYKYHVSETERAIEWPWKYKTPAEKYPVVKFNGKQFTAKSQNSIHTEVMGEVIGNCVAEGLDSDTGKAYTETFEVRKIKGISEELMIAVGNEDGFYVYAADEEAVPDTLSKLLELYELSQNLELNYATKCEGYEEKEELLKRYKEDVFRFQMEQLTKACPCGILEISSPADGEETELIVYPFFEKTCDFLESRGIDPEKQIKDYPVESVEIKKTSAVLPNVSGGSYVHFYEEPEEVDQWKEKLIPKAFDVQQILYPTDHTQNAEAVVTDEETASYVRVKCILK